MAVLPVLIYPDPILRQQSVAVTLFDDALDTLIQDMLATMHAHKGVGLAAPQVGILQQVIVMEFEGKKMALINPEIIPMKGTTVEEEGCLSLPDTRVIIERADKIIVKAQNKKGQVIQIREKGYFSRIIQHETDHLKGILIIDKAPLEHVFPQADHTL